MPQRATLSIIIIAMISIIGCSTEPRKTGELHTKPEFHPAALDLDKREYQVAFPSYLLAFEKDDRDIIGRPSYQNCETGKSYCFNTKASYFEEHQDKASSSVTWDIRKRFREPNTVFLSHLIRYESPKIGSRENSFLYNIYSPDSALNGREAREERTANYVTQSWDVLVNDFKNDLRERVISEGYTHILLYSTGWNTQQGESIDNYRDWFGKLTKAINEHSRECENESGVSTSGIDCIGSGAQEISPLFVGLTWDSDWPNLPGPTDYVNKAHDADEIGLMWANLLVNKVLKEVKTETGVKLIVIGHSFGARLLSRAVHSAPLIIANETMSPPIDLFIGLQAAFSYKRFVQKEGSEGSPYWDYPKRANKFLFTSSDFDHAVDTAPAAVLGKTSFLGDEAAYAETVSRQQSGDLRPPVFEHRNLTQNGWWLRAPSGDKDKITLFDAKEVVKTNKPGTGGLAHSDVFDFEIARFILQAIMQAAPAR